MGVDTRPLNPDHVFSLAESIAGLGLAQPIAVDARGRLIAGGHRLAAMRLLAELDADERMGAATKLIVDAQGRPDTTAGRDLLRRVRNLIRGECDPKAVPVLRMTFDAKARPERALALEIAENEKRRDYRPEDVRELVDR